MKYSLLLIISKTKIYYILPTQKAQLKKKVFCTHILTSAYNLRMRWYLGNTRIMPEYYQVIIPKRKPHFVSYTTQRRQLFIDIPVPPYIKSFIFFLFYNYLIR